MTLQKYVVITRPIEESADLCQKLENLGLRVFSFPSIAVHKSLLTDETKKTLSDLSSFDWIVFTSRNGVRYFFDAITQLGIDVSIPQTKHIAVVGTKTADEAKKYGLPIHVIPSEFTTSDLAQELQNIKGKKMLLPRANIATPILTEKLKEKGAFVTNIAIYNTECTKFPYDKFEQLLDNNEILCLTFTSPSTVEGFLKNVEGIKEKSKVFSLPAISIGPVTTQALKKHGFQHIYTAKIHTIDGMLSKLQESIL